MEESAENVADRSVDQQQLSGVIKGVHKRLRRKYRDFVSHDDDGGQERRSWEEVWREHVQQEPAMQEYSRAMHSLACRVWKSRGESRLHWCVDACREYFLGGALQNLLLKDRRRRLRDHSSAEARKDPSSEASLAESEWQHQLTAVSEENWVTASHCQCCVHSTWPTSPTVGSESIRLLDVGSCYNPFTAFDGFQPVAIDLAPAVETTLRGDFTQLSVSATTDCESTLQQLSSPVVALPACSFHAVVFCLFLSYLPSPEQRWLCCVRAHRLLLPGGLLLIVTPDSSHVGRHAPIMRQWKESIERVGFRRWRYDKQQHLHCMAFRRLPGMATDGPVGTLAIPQDNREDCSSDEDLFSEPRTVEDDENVAQNFSELPSFGSASDEDNQ